VRGLALCERHQNTMRATIIFEGYRKGSYAGGRGVVVVVVVVVVV